MYDELRGGYFLRWRDGIGAVRLLSWKGRDMLLEYGGDHLLTDVIASQGDNAATEIAADVLARLLSPSPMPPPAELQPLRARFVSLFAKAQAITTGAKRGPYDALYREAAALADGLLSDQRDVKPLHGDLHHENIIHGPRGWLIIDPKGVSGDPAFDAGNMFFNPLGARDGLALNPNRIALMAETFGRAIDQSAARILDFAVAYGCLSAAWHAEDNNDEEERLELGVVAALRDVRATF